MAKQTITDKIFADEYAKFQKLFKNMGTDADFAEYLNKNYLTKTGKSFNTDLIFYKRSALGVDTPVGTVLPSKLKRFNEVNNFTTKEVAKANLGNKFVRIEDIKNKVLKKFNLKSFPNFKSEGYPVLNNLEKIPDKIDKVLRSLLISKQPLKQRFIKEIAKLTGVSIDSIDDNIPKSQTYNTIKDQGADLIKKSKGFPKDFYELPFSKQLPYAIEVSSGRPRYTGMGGITRYSAKPQNRIMEFAIRSWDNTKGKGPVKFYDKNGKLITWGYGKKLPYTKVQWSYNGKRHNFDKLKSVDYMQKHFPEAYTKLKAVNNLNVKPVDNPFKKGTKIPFRDLIKKIQVDGYGWKPTKGGLDILHGKKGVALEPFTNLTYASRDINQLESGIAQSLRANKITKTQANEAIKTIRQDIKGLTGEALDTAIINRQLDLSKQIQSGKISSYQDVKNLVYTQVRQNLLSKSINNTDDVCGVVFGIGKAAGGVAGGGCARQMEFAFDNAPEETLNKISQSNNLKLKTFAQRALSIFPKLGTPGKIAAGAVAGAAAIGALTYNKELGEFVNPLNDDKASQATVTEWIKDNPVKTVAGTSIGFSAQEIPGAYKKARELGRGRTRSALGITGALKPVLTTFGTPAMTALFEAPFAAKRLEEGETMTEVLTDPLGPALGLTFMEPLSRGAGVIRGGGAAGIMGGIKRAFNPFDLSNVGTARPGLTSKILRMGMSPRVIAGISRLGPYGMLAGAGLAAFDQYKKYQNEEGMLYNLLNE